MNHIDPDAEKMITVGIMIGVIIGILCRFLIIATRHLPLKSGSG